MGLNGAANDLTVALATTDTATTAVGKINAAISANATVAATGIKAVDNAGTIDFVNGAGNSFAVQTAGDVSNALGFGSWTSSTGLAATAGTFNYTSLTAVGAGTVNTENLQVSINGGAATADLGAADGKRHGGNQPGDLECGVPGQRGDSSGGPYRHRQRRQRRDHLQRRRKLPLEFLRRNRRRFRFRSRRCGLRFVHQRLDQQLRGSGQH